MEGPRASNNLGAAACNQPLLTLKTAASHDANTYKKAQLILFRVVTVKYNIGLLQSYMEPQFGVFSLGSAG